MTYRGALVKGKLELRPARVLKLTEVFGSR